MNVNIRRVGSALACVAFGVVVGFLASACGSKSGSGIGQIGQSEARAEPAAAKWEYKTVYLPNTGKAADDHEKYDKALNDGAAGGWELTQWHYELAIYRRAK